MYSVKERRITDVFMSGQVHEVESLVSRCASLEEARVLKLLRHKKRGTPLDKLFIYHDENLIE